MAQQTQNMTSSDFNLQKLTTKGLSKHIEGAIQIGQNVAIFGRRGTGKMLDLETELPTPTGFIRLKDLKEGDVLFDEDGNTCNVIQLHPIDYSPKSYMVYFDDGTIVKACADHLWLTWDKKARKNKSTEPMVRSTQEMFETLKVSSKNETNHSIPTTLPVNYSEKNLPISPYVLGCWLGNGRNSNGSIECAEQEILNNIEKCGYSYNKTGKIENKSKSSNYRIGDLVKKNDRLTGLLTYQLKALNLINNKHIPDCYLYSSINQRLELLQGLMDTDGCCSSRDHSMEFTTVYPELASNFMELVSSLGIKATLNKNESFLYGKKCKDRYRVHFITKLPVFKLDRKLANIKSSLNQDTRNTHRYIVSIEKIDPVPMRCITVDSPSHLYLITRSFIATHNTEISKYEIAKADYHEVYLNLSVLERVDMGGYPNIMASQQQKAFVDFLLPQFYEPMITNCGKEVVALLDEVDKADPSLWAPLLEFTQFRSINGRKLPQLRSVIMTGNLISEGGARPSLPLLDRAEKYLVEADATSWLEWAGKQGHIHPSITAYITDHPKDLFGNVDPEDRYADPSPRGWDRASQILWLGEDRNWGSDLLNEKVAGCVGKDAGIKYSNYYEHYQQLLPMIEDVFNGKDVSARYNPLEPTKKLVACMITCARLATQLDQSDEDNPPSSIKHVGKFLQKVSYENVLVAVRSQIQINRLVKFNLDEHPDWEVVLNKINKKVDD